MLAHILNQKVSFHFSAIATDDVMSSLMGQIILACMSIICFLLFLKIIQSLMKKTF